MNLEPSDVQRYGCCFNKYCTMSKELIKQRILKEKPKSEKEFSLFERTDAWHDELNAEVPENFLQDPNIFLLNKLLLTVQFFENYERDVKILRENWYKEISLESHHKKCFYADSLFRASGAKVKFSPLHGINKNSRDFLQPPRIYIFSDNVKAAFDPTILRHAKTNVWPQYSFQLKMDENDEKLGSAFLILLKTSETPMNHFDSAMLVNENLNFPYVQEKSSNSTRTDKFFTSYNKELNFKMQEKRISIKCFKEREDGVLPPNSFYYFATPEESLNSVSIVKYRMNTTPMSNHEIPQACFQRESMKANFKTKRRVREEKFYRQRNILNSAAFKGYFCDILIEKLAEPLGFDVDDIQAGIVHEEFAIFGHEIKIHITHAVEISDWSSFIPLTEHRFNAKFTPEVAWPTNQMWEIVNTLPCYAVPDGGPDLSRKNLDHEKKWKIVFPKTEEFLLLHMTHSQIRCYFFILSIYKSFIESEINTASLGPKHLLHLLFWQVHKNFLAWPDERPAEILLSYLKILYKKLQNKFLRDFFINSRNLFASSFAKDIHKAQVLIKMILQNPVPYVLRAIRNLEFDSNFYPAFEAVKVNAILRPSSIGKNRSKRFTKEKIEKNVYQTNAARRENIKQMQSLSKAEGEGSRKNSISSIDIEHIINFDFRDSEKLSQILEILILHYIEMGNVSIKFKFLAQAFMYLFQTQSLFELMSNDKLNKEDSEVLRQKMKKLKEKCDGLEREEKLIQTKPLDKTKLFVNPTAKLKIQQQMIHSENNTPEKQQDIYGKNVTKIKVVKNSSHHLMGENEDWETQL